MPTTYDCIASTTLSSSNNTISLSGINSTYTDLVVVFDGALTSGSATCNLRFNSDTNQNYSQINMAGQGTNASGSNNASQGSLRLGEVYVGLTSTGFLCIFNIMNYANTTNHKQILWRLSDKTGEVGMYTGSYRSTSAISELAFSTSISFAAGTRASIYGIKAA